MTVEERRQCLYASLLRFTPEATSLRERALDKIILVSLVGSAPEDPYRVGRIRENINASSGPVGVRTEVVQEVLSRLIAEDKVKEVEHRKRRAYHLTDLGNSEVETSETTSAQLFEPVLAELIKDLDPSINAEDARDIFIQFISGTFSAFGHKIAQVVTGTLANDDFADSVNINTLVGRAIGNRSLESHVVESIKARCRMFIRNEDPTSDRLKFRLTQGFYVAQLVGLDSGAFNPLARESFDGAVMFLDTNTVLARIMDLDEATMFDEIVSISTDLGIELRISRATIDELEDVLSRRLDDLREVISTVPPELIAHSGGDFIDAYVKWAARNEASDFDDFVSSLETVDSVIEDSDILLDNRDADDIVNSRDIERVCKIISRAAEDSRGWGKHEMVSKHDAAHYLAVSDIRKEGGKSWFLTRDRTLTVASARLAKDELPFSMPLLGFLQAISPFVDANGRSDALADFFSHGLSEDISGLSSVNLFDLQELRLIGEYHEDVLATPPDELVLALDYVKSNVLNGRKYRLEDNPKFSLGLKKFLSSSVDEREAALRAEVERQQQLVEQERARLVEAQRQIKLEQAAKAQLVHTAAGKEQDVADAKEATRMAQKEAALLRGALFLLGGLGAAAIWNADDLVANAMLNGRGNIELDVEVTSAAVRVAGSILFFVSSLPVLSNFDKGTRVGLMTASLAVAVMGADIFAGETLAAWSDVLGVCAPICLLLYIMFVGTRSQNT